MSYEGTPYVCKECTATCPGHKWGKIKATEEGWVFLKSGDAYCPSHTPAWYADWKAGQS